MMTLLVLALATWRISSLLSEEEGPLHVFAKLRERVKCVSEHAYEGLTCNYCNSVWIGAAFAWLYVINGQVAFYAALPFALSAAAIAMVWVENICVNVTQKDQAR